MELSQNRCEHGQLIIPKSVREELFTFSLRYKSQLDPPQVHPVHPSDRLLVAALAPKQYQSNALL